MKVIDAGAIVELLVNDLDPARLGDEELAVPHLIDSEVTNVLRRLVAHQVITLLPILAPNNLSKKTFKL